MFSTSHQAQFLAPMAISVAYGLLYGTILTLLMLPAMLVLLNRLRLVTYKITKKGKKLSAETVEPAIREEIFAREQSNGTCEDK